MTRLLTELGKFEKSKPSKENDLKMARNSINSKKWKLASLNDSEGIHHPLGS